MQECRFYVSYLELLVLYYFNKIQASKVLNQNETITNRLSIYSNSNCFDLFAVCELSF
jgi:hypothetical protein